MEEIIKELEQIGAELFNKYGTDCYTTRCRLHDAREKLKALTIQRVDQQRELLIDFANTYDNCHQHDTVENTVDWYLRVKGN